MDSGWKAWLWGGDRLDESQHHGDAHPTHPWYMVLWLTGVDYFSTLGYQPGLALLAAGSIAPLATAILVLVTLASALPVYAQVAGRSYAGQGSIAMLESLLPGWYGKLLVLVLLGFAATDFVITMTLSAADAAAHAVENPLLHPYLGHAQVEVTLALLLLLALVFLRGFKEAIGLAALIAIPYLLLNAVVLARCLQEISAHPEYIANWKNLLTAQGDPSQLVLAAVLLFPSLALGLSGFETGVSVMPLVEGNDKPQPVDEDGEEIGEKVIPRGRIRNTRRLLVAAALIMSCFLLVSSISVTLLIPEEVYKKGGDAYGRAIAYLAHKFLGPVFGTAYDMASILILWFAGASAMAGLLHLIPRYLPRFGMAPDWVAYTRPLVLLLLGVDVIVTLIFHADVEKQGGAYATGVLALMFSAALASALALWKEGKKLWSLGGWGTTLVFLYTLLDNVHTRPDGLIISSIFILAILIFGGISRYQRSLELRVRSLQFADEESELVWKDIIGKKVNLVPARTVTAAARAAKERDIRKHYSVGGPLAFVCVRQLDNRSEFFAPLKLRVRKDGDNYLIFVTQAIAISNTIAYISELIDPISIFLGLTRQDLMSQSLRYFLFGEGETGIRVYQILLRYWDSTPEDDVRPLIFLMSE